MKQSRLFTKTLRTLPKEAVSINHQLLIKAGFISEVSSGIWNFLPLGLRVYRKIENIIRQEMNKLNAEELYLTGLQPKSLWSETGRWQTIDPPLFKFKDRHSHWLALGSTHEEAITSLARQFIHSYKDLPKAIYQIQNKFRNELRSSAGLLRCREFMMKDLYSFHQNQADLDQFYQKVINTYYRIYQRLELKSVMVESLSGSIGGSQSNEFMVFSLSGEDKVLYCSNCLWASNIEKGSHQNCPKCQTKLDLKEAIEVGHIFKLGTKYSEIMKAYFTDRQGKPQPILMGCYGIGLGRLIATIVENNHDKKGIIWPKSVSPFDIHLLGLDLNDRSVAQFAEKVYTQLKEGGFDVLYDDRQESSAVKLKDADLIGISLRIVVSKKTGLKIEVKKRSEKKSELMRIENFLNP